MIDSSKYQKISTVSSINTEVKMNSDVDPDNITLSNGGGQNSIPQMLSYYPKYNYLDNLIDVNKKNTINIFVDVKGCCALMYTKWCVEHVLESSSIQRHMNLDLFSSVLYFIAFHKRYASKRNVKFNIIFFMEQGKSKYHLNVYKEYKSNRLNSDFFGLDAASRDKFFQILDKNYNLCEYVINKIPNCSFYCLKYCEADFVPYYLMKKKFTKEQLENSINIIYSKDKDMLQCLEFDNTYQFYRAGHNDKSCFITEDTIYTHYVKKECEKIRNGAKWFPLFLALCGDSSDGIPGIKGIGAKVLWKQMDTIMKAYGYDPDVMYKRVLAGDNLLMESWEHKANATIEKVFSCPDIVKRNMKLISYRALTEYVEGCFPLEAIDIQKYIDKIWNFDNKLSSYNVLWNTLKSKGLDDIVNINTVQDCFL